MSETAADIVNDIVLSESELKATDARILDAAVATFAEFGFRGPMEEVALRAGVSRVTLYRRFVDRDALVQAVILRESRKCLRDMVQEFATLDSEEERLVRGFAASVRIARSHPLCKLLMETDSEVFSKYTTTTVSALIDLGRNFTSASLKQRQPTGGYSGLNADYLAEIIIRLWHSIVIAPTSLINSDDEESVVRLARDFLYPLFTGKR